MYYYDDDEDYSEQRYIPEQEAEKDETEVTEALLAMIGYYD